MAKMTASGVKLLLNPINEGVQNYVDASDLATFFNLAREIKDLDNSAYLVCGVCNDKTVIHQQITLKWAKGEYLFWIPTHCDYYTQFRQIFEPEFIPVSVGDLFTDNQGNKFRVSRLNQCLKKEIAGECTYSGYASLNSLQIALKGATRFAKGAIDYTYMKFSGIALHFTDTDLHVYGGDTSQMFCSDVIRMDTENAGEHMAVISQTDAKQILSITQNTPISLSLTDEHLIIVYTDLKKEIAYTLLGSSKIHSLNPIYPNVSRFMPDLSGKMTFDSKQATNRLKQALAVSDKSHNKVKLHLNGCIEMSALSDSQQYTTKGLKRSVTNPINEVTATMPYLSKSFPDTDMVLNGKTLVNALGYFKGDVIMHSDGDGLKPVILRGNSCGQLLMATFKQQTTT